MLDHGTLPLELSQPSYQDVDYHIENGSFTLRRAGSYRPIANICALPPKTCWWVTADRYVFSHDLKLSRVCADSISLDDLLDYAVRVLMKLSKGKKIAVELSGGLDSSIIIEFLRRQPTSFFLVGFTSKRYEFRTERAIQLHYQDRCPSAHLIPYEDCSLFGALDEVPAHPFPAQECLYYSRHKAMARACATHGIDVLLSGTAGDPLLGYAPEPCSANGQAPTGCAYWNLAEMWSNQHVYQPLGCNYVSALALGRLPAMLLQARSGEGADPKKMWARQKFRDYLPKYLADFAYKAHHDGVVIDHLSSALSSIDRVSTCAYKLTGHPALAPSLMSNDVRNFRFLSRSQQENLYSRLAFATWAFSNEKSMNRME